MSLIDGLFFTCQCQSQHCEYSDLPGKCFSGCHANLRSYVDVRTGMCGTRNGWTDRITNAVNKRTATFCQFYGCQCIGRLATLRNGDHNIIFTNHRITITKFRGVFYLHRYTAETFDQMLADQSGMPRGSTSHNNKAFCFQKPFLIVDNGRKHNTGTFHIDTSAHTIMNAIGLFENLFQHKMWVTAFLKLSQVKFHFSHFGCHFHIIKINHL